MSRMKLPRASVTTMALHIASRTSGISPLEIVSREKTHDRVAARRHLYALLFNAGRSLVDISDEFDRDHTTILHSLRRVSPDDVAPDSRVATVILKTEQENYA